MRLVDTSAWIELLIGSRPGELIRPHVPKRDVWVVPTIVQFELVKWTRREMGEAGADDILAFTQTCRVITLDTAIACAAAELASRWGLSVADAVIYATSRSTGADLLTADAHFRDLEGVTYISKQSEY